MSKPYWAWTCHQCAHDDNRNTDRTCTQCGAAIRCIEAGGHHWSVKQEYCDRGCGTHRDGTVELTQRREDY